LVANTLLVIRPSLEALGMNKCPLHIHHLVIDDPHSIQTLGYARRGLELIKLGLKILKGTCQISCTVKHIFCKENVNVDTGNGLVGKVHQALQKSTIIKEGLGVRLTILYKRKKFHALDVSWEPGEGWGNVWCTTRTDHMYIPMEIPRSPNTS
jgi:hypothetical protein